MTVVLMRSNLASRPRWDLASRPAAKVSYMPAPFHTVRLKCGFEKSMKTRENVTYMYDLLHNITLKMTHASSHKKRKKNECFDSIGRVKYFLYGCRLYYLWKSSSKNIILKVIDLFLNISNFIWLLWNSKFKVSVHSWTIIVLLFTLSISTVYIVLIFNRQGVPNKISINFFRK